MAEEFKYNMEKQEVHTVEVLVPMRDLGGSPNQGCKHFHMVHLLEAPCRRVYSPIEGFYSLSLTYMH